MTAPYRLPAARVPEPPAAEPVFQADPCPMCGRVRHQSHGPQRGTFCRGAGWLGRLFGGCRLAGDHLHVYCDNCGWRWIARLEER